MLESLKIAAYRAVPRRWKMAAVRCGTPNYTVGAIGLVTDDGSRTLFVRLTYRDKWWPPGGFLAKGETPEQALAREYVEELGIEVSFCAPHRVHLDPDRRSVTFVCAGVMPAGAAPTPRGPEVVEAQWFPLDALPDLSSDFRERVTDADLVALRQLVQT